MLPISGSHHFVSCCAGDLILSFWKKERRGGTNFRHAICSAAAPGAVPLPIHPSSSAAAPPCPVELGDQASKLLPTSQFLAPGLESLQLLPSLRHDCKPLPLGSARAQAGAYQKDAFVEGTEATKIAQVRGSPFLDYHNILL